MTVKQINVERFSVITSKPFEQVVAKLDAAIGHPDMRAFGRDMMAAKSYAELEDMVQKAVGPSDLMEFTRFDLGSVLRKERKDAPRSLRLVAAIRWS